MKTLILAGGLGTRLRPFTFTIPKPLLPIGEKSILELLIEKLRVQGFTDIILSVGYKANMIEAYFGDGKRFGVDISYVHEEERLGTAGPIWLAKKLLFKESDFLLMNGDIYTDISFNKLVEFHLETSAVLTVAIRKHFYQSPYGVIGMDIDSRVIKNIVEKPTQFSLINAGIYVVNTGILHMIYSSSVSHVGMTGLIEMLIERGSRVVGYVFSNVWYAIDDLKNMDDLNKLDNLNKLEIN